jgi:hypothetical protein
MRASRAMRGRGTSETRTDGRRRRQSQTAKTIHAVVLMLYPVVAEMRV